MARSSWMTSSRFTTPPSPTPPSPSCSSLTALPLAEWFTCSHLVLGSEDSQTNRVWILTGWPGRQTYRIWREWCLGEGQVGWADLTRFWEPRGLSVEKVLFELLGALASITAPLKTVWVSCWASLPLSWTPRQAISLRTEKDKASPRNQQRIDACSLTLPYKISYFLLQLLKLEIHWLEQLLLTHFSSSYDINNTYYIRMWREREGKKGEVPTMGWWKLNKCCMNELMLLSENLVELFNNQDRHVWTPRCII